MSKELISELLQECLAAYDAGVSPEDCLSAFPTRRAELQPLFRQALTLRVAYAAAPQEEFRGRAKAAMMFAAGREVAQAFSAKPDPEFVADARSKFMNTAGAQAQAAFRAMPEPNPRYVANARRRFIDAAGAPAQEALRAVPPPRLPFWWNTRRSLLEAAAAKNMRQSAPVRRGFGFGSFAFQAGLSVAVVVLAVAAGTLTFFVSSTETPSSAAEIASIERQLNDIDARWRAGQPVSASEVITLTKKTAELAEKLNDQPSTSGAGLLPALKERQMTVLANVYANETPPPEVVQAQQQLDKAAASVQASPAAAAASTATKAPATVVPATATAPAVAVSTPILPPPVANQARIGILPDNRVEVTTAGFRFVIPRDWGITPGGGIAIENGAARLTGDWVFIAGQGVPVAINVATGRIEALIASQPVLLRTSDPTGRAIIIPAEELVARAAPVSTELVIALRGLLESFMPTTTNLAAPPPLPPPPGIVPSTVSPIPSRTPSVTPRPASSSTPVPQTPTTTRTAIPIGTPKP